MKLYKRMRRGKRIEIGIFSPSEATSGGSGRRERLQNQTGKVGEEAGGEEEES